MSEQDKTDGACVLFSGGQDSTTCLGWALNHYEGSIACVSFNYGQRHRVELLAAARVVKFFKEKTGRDISHSIVNISQAAFAGMSPLTNKSQELETYQNFEQMDDTIGDRVEKTFVPMRNAVFLMLAANRAFAAGYRHLITGVCQADNANYPDCRADFIKSAQNTINLALGIQDFIVYAPLMFKTKAESIKLALSLPHTYAALVYTHTAYDGKYPPVGQDHASILRAQGFFEAGVPDPLVIRAWREGFMSLPMTSNYDVLRMTEKEEARGY